MALALDISNYTGELSVEQARWVKERYDLVVVRLSTEDNHRQRDIAAQQVRTLAEQGMPWQGYLWMYWDQYPDALWRLATERLPDGWPGYYGLNIWIDLEDQPDDPHLAATCLQAYLDILETDAFAPGIYTGSWWVEQNDWIAEGAIGRKLRLVPAWWANYGIDPTCNLALPHPIRHLAMHQYAAHQSLGPLMACDESLICNVL